MKKQGFGKGKWNGFGGKVIESENAKYSAQRELREEAAIEAPNLNYRGIVTCEYPSIDETHIIHIFTTDEFIGTPRESEEMSPKWFSYSDIPYSEMFDDMKSWLPILLDDASGLKKITANFKLSAENKILEKNLEFV